MKKYLVGICICLVTVLLFGQPEYSSDSNLDGKKDYWVEHDDTDVKIIKTDTDYDGKIDYITKFNKNDKKIYEELDSNSDGVMDNFYYYSKGKLVSQEVDSNFDGKIDIWVYLEEGVYITGYERDIDFDGEPDVIKDFTKEKR